MIRESAHFPTYAATISLKHTLEHCLQLETARAENANLPQKGGGANRVSLQEARENFSRIGACEKRWKRHVRAPLPEEIP